MTTTPEDLAAEVKRLAAEYYSTIGWDKGKLPASREKLHEAIDRLAAMASSAQQGEPVAAWLNKFMPVVAQLDGIELVRRSDAVAAINARPTAPAEPADPVAEACRLSDSEIHDIADNFKSQYMHGGTTFDEFDYLGFARALQANDATKGKTNV